MRVLVIGCGAIGSALAREAKTLGHDVLVHDLVMDKAHALAAELGARAVPDPKTTLGQTHLVVEAATAEAVRQWAVPAVASGADVLLMSVGALVDDALVKALVNAAARTHRRVFVPSGAMAGLDAVKAFATVPGATCTLTTRKPPKSLGLSATKPTVVFEGDYKAAIAKFPKNVNVAAALALSGIAPTVRIIADPSVTRNTHEVVVEAPHARVTIKVESEPSASNPATSELALQSAVATLRRIGSRLRVGT